MPAISPEASVRLRILNFPLIVGVVYIHAYSASIDHAGVTLGPGQLDVFTDSVRIFISQGLARIAVPLFFLISGYFFFLGFSGSWRDYWQKLASRIKTLLVPYLFWTAFVLGIRFLGQSFAISQDYFAGDGEMLAQLSAYDMINAAFGFTRVPVAYHFWFIRDLMLLMLFSPLLFFLLRYFSWLFIGSTFLFWISAEWPVQIPDAVGVLFFSAGGYLALRGKDLFILDRYGKAFVLAYLPLLVADVIWYDASFNHYLHRGGIVVGLVAILYLSKLLAVDARVKDSLLWLSGISFFIYAAHEPLLGIVRTIAFQLLPLQWPSMMLVTYLLVPPVVVAILVVTHELLAKKNPGFLRLITGGR